MWLSARWPTWPKKTRPAGRPSATSPSSLATCAAASRTCNASRSAKCCANGRKNSPAGWKTCSTRCKTSCPRTCSTPACTTSKTPGPRAWPARTATRHSTRKSLQPRRNKWCKSCQCGGRREPRTVCSTHTGTTSQGAPLPCCADPLSPAPCSWALPPPSRAAAAHAWSMARYKAFPHWRPCPRRPPTASSACPRRKPPRSTHSPPWPSSHWPPPPRHPTPHPPGCAPPAARAERSLARAGLQRDDAAPRLLVQIGIQADSVPRYDSLRGPGFYGFYGPPPWAWRDGWGLHGFWRMAEPTPLYRRAVSLVLRDATTQAIVYETSAVHEDTWVSDPAVYGVLFDAALNGFPQPPGGARQVPLPLTPTTP